MPTLHTWNVSKKLRPVALDNELESALESLQGIISPSKSQVHRSATFTAVCQDNQADNAGQLAEPTQNDDTRQEHEPLPPANNSTQHQTPVIKLLNFKVCFEDSGDHYISHINPTNEDSKSKQDDCKQEATDMGHLSTVLFEEYKRELKELRECYQRLDLLKSAAAEKVSKGNTHAANWQIYSMDNLREDIRRKILRLVDMSKSLSIPYWLCGDEQQPEDVDFHTFMDDLKAQISCTTTTTASPKKAVQKRVSFSDEEAITVGCADHDYDRSGVAPSDVSRFENLILRVFGTYPEEFPELFGYSW